MITDQSIKIAVSVGLLALIVGEVLFLVNRVLLAPAVWVAIYRDMDPSQKPTAMQLLHRELMFYRRVDPPLGLPVDHFAADFFSCLVLEEGADVQFELGSDGESRLSIGRKLLIINEEIGRNKAKSNRQRLNKGAHLLKVEYKKQGRDRSSLFLKLGANGEYPSGRIKNLVKPVASAGGLSCHSSNEAVVNT